MSFSTELQGMPSSNSNVKDSYFPLRPHLIRLNGRYFYSTIHYLSSIILFLQSFCVTLFFVFFSFRRKLFSIFHNYVSVSLCLSFSVYLYDFCPISVFFLNLSVSDSLYQFSYQNKMHQFGCGFR